MLSDFLSGARPIVERYGAAASDIVNNLYGPALKAYGVGLIVVVEPYQLTLAMRGRLTRRRAPRAACLSLNDRTIDIGLDAIKKGGVESAARALKAAFECYALEGAGAYVWIVPDGYMAALSAQEKKWARDGGGYFSHESLCVQNTGPRATRCELTVYFEAPGRKVLRHAFDVPAQRSIHLRLDKIPGTRGAPFIPKSSPVGHKIVSYDAPVVVQGSRILTSGKDSEFASFGTTMAWAPA